MKNLGENCKECKCSTCKCLPKCDTMCGNTNDYCELDCFGEDGCTDVCSEYEKE